MRCVCDYGEICQAHGDVKVTTRIMGAMPRLTEKRERELRKQYQSFFDAVEGFRESVRSSE